MAFSRKGFSLIETLLYIAVSAVVVSVVGISVGTINHAKARSVTRQEVEEQGRYVLEMILQTARNASAINTPASGSTGTSLSLTVDTAGLSPTVFQLTGDTITVSEGAAAEVAMTNSQVIASSLSVQNLTRASTPGTVRVSFTLSGQVTSGTSPYVYQQTFYGSASLQ